MQRENLGDLDVGVVGFDRLERAADFAWSIRLHVKGVHLAWRAEIEDQDHRFPGVTWAYAADGLKRGEVGEREAEGTQRADLEEVAARDTIASSDGTIAGDDKHKRKTNL